MLNLLHALALMPAMSFAFDIRSHAKDVSDQNRRDIIVDASKIVGQLKNLQGTNNGNTDLVAPGLDNIHDEVPAIAELWSSYGIKQVLIYNWPDVFQGYGKSGNAGSATNDANYDWTVTDAYIKFVTSHGAKASINYNSANSINSSISSPQLIQQIAYAITDRYMNGAHGSGFQEALNLFDFFAEADAFNVPNPQANYDAVFPYFVGFAKGVNKANSKAGAGAWGGNRVFPVNTNYTVHDPFVTQFYKDCKAQNVPIKAATYHFTNAQYSLDPYSVKTVTDAFRSHILEPAGLPDLPIWITEYELNPGGVLPDTAAALADYNDPAFVASYTIGTSMYAQDTSLDQAFTWTGFGYGGYGAGGAYFTPWFNNATRPPTPLNVAAAWKLQASLVQDTPNRLSLTGSSPDGFAALAGRSNSKVQVLLNNYQLNYDIVREIANITAPYINASTAAYPVLQSNGLLNGEQACFNAGNSRFFVPVCQTFPLATVRNNPSTSYKVQISNLPWSRNSNYRVTIQRVGDGKVQRVYKTSNGRGNSVDLSYPFPKNAQDLITIESCK